MNNNFRKTMHRGTTNRGSCIFCYKLTKAFFLISEIKAGGTDVPKVSNVQTRNIQVNQGLEISSVCKLWHVF